MSSDLSAQEFEMLKEEWIRDTGLMSNLSGIHDHWAYQEIISHGKAALPYIFMALREDVYHWFWALTQITGKDVAKGETTMQGARDKWLAWAEEQGYV